MSMVTEYAEHGEETQEIGGFDSKGNSCMKWTSAEKREICVYKTQQEAATPHLIAAHFTTQWGKHVADTSISELLATWLPQETSIIENQHPKVLYQNVSLDQAREGILRAISYLEAHPCAACYHIHTLWLIVQYLSEHTGKLKVDSETVKYEQNLFDTVADDVDETVIPDQKESESVTDTMHSSQDALIEIPEDMLEDSTANDTFDLSLNNQADDDDDDSAAMMTSLPIELMVKETKINVAGVKYGIFTKTAIAAGLKWGPYYTTGHNSEIVDLSMQWMKYVRATSEVDQHNINVVRETDQICYSTSRDLASGVELLTLPDNPLNKLNTLHKPDNSKEEKLSYKCSLCARVFTTLHQLSKHEESHSKGQAKFVCELCRSCFTCKRNLQLHKMTHTGEKPHQCIICGKGFIQKTSLNRHMTVHTDSENQISYEPSSKVVSLMGTLPNELKANISTGTGAGVKWGIFAAIPLQPGVKWGPYVVEEHPKLDSKRGRSKIKIGSNTKWMKFVRYTDDVQNIRVLEENGLIFYEITREISPESELMTSWTESLFLPTAKSKPKVHRCGQCNKRFSTSDELTIHKVSCANRPYKCCTCHRSFLTEIHLRDHRRVHERERSHTCTECGKMFASSRDMSRHQRIHSGERPYTCPVCNKTFTQQGSISRHMVVHTGIKPHMCDICGKHFTDISHFRRHQKIHIGNRCHVCTICHKSFLYADKLRQHTRIHTGEKPFQCHICGKHFGCDSSFSKHKKTHQDSTQVRAQQPLVQQIPCHDLGVL